MARAEKKPWYGYTSVDEGACENCGNTPSSSAWGELRSLKMLDFGRNAMVRIVVCGDDCITPATDKALNRLVAERVAT